MTNIDQSAGPEQRALISPYLLRSWWTVGLLTVCTLVAYTGMLSLNLLVDPIKADLGISDVQFSLLQGAAYVIPVVISGILFGFLADRYSRRLLLAIGLTIWGTGTIGCGMAENFSEFAVARALLGFGKGALVPVAITMVAQVFPPIQRGKALGFFFVGIGMGPGIGIWIAGIFYDYAQLAIQSGSTFFGDFSAWRIVFLVIGIPAVLLLPLLLTMLDPRRQQDDDKKPAGEEPDPSRASKGLLFACIFAGLIMVAFSDTASISWIPAVFTRQFEYSIADAGAVFAIIAIGGGGAGPLLAGWTSDKIYARFGARGRLAACAAGSLFLSALYLSFLAAPPDLLVVALIGVAILVTGIGTVGMVVIQEFLPDRLRGLGTGLTYSFGMLVAGNGATAVAIVADQLYSPQQIGLAISTVCSPVALIAAGLLLLATKLSANPGESADSQVLARG